MHNAQGSLTSQSLGGPPLLACLSATDALLGVSGNVPTMNPVLIFTEMAPMHPLARVPSIRWANDIPQLFSTPSLRGVGLAFRTFVEFPAVDSDASGAGGADSPRRLVVGGAPRITPQQGVNRPNMVSEG